MGISATLLHQIPFLRDRGVSATQASLVLGMTAGIGVAGKLGFGWLLDRFEQRRVIMWCFGMQALGLLCLMIPTSWLTLSMYVLVYGFAMGGNATMQATVLGECFGRLHYGTIAGRMNPLIVVIQAAGIPFAGAVRDALGTYMPALLVILLGNVLAVACIAGLDVEAAPPEPVT